MLHYRPPGLLHGLRLRVQGAAATKWAPPGVVFFSPTATMRRVSQQSDYRAGVSPHPHFLLILALPLSSVLLRLALFSPCDPSFILAPLAFATSLPRLNLLWLLPLPTFPSFTPLRLRASKP